MYMSTVYKNIGGRAFLFLCALELFALNWKTLRASRNCAILQKNEGLLAIAVFPVSNRINEGLTGS